MPERTGSGENRVPKRNSRKINLHASHGWNLATQSGRSNAVLKLGFRTLRIRPQAHFRFGPWDIPFLLSHQPGEEQEYRPHRDA